MGVLTRPHRQQESQGMRETNRATGRVFREEVTNSTPAVPRDVDAGGRIVRLPVRPLVTSLDCPPPNARMHFHWSIYLALLIPSSPSGTRPAALAASWSPPTRGCWSRRRAPTWRRSGTRRRGPRQRVPYFRNWVSV